MESTAPGPISTYSAPGKSSAECRTSEVAGPEWLDPDLFRFGASSLLNDLILQRQKQRTGAYSGPDYVTLD
ncbi:MAG TPA: hypothetical protein VLM05_11750 [Mycobacteriales bacterium]|nr:hypothetical protein [Mycobacteriales bacterium]